MSKKLNAYTRLPLDPYSAQFFVLCEELIAGGVPLKFGDTLPDYMDLNHLHVHFNNGAVGTQEEFDNLNAPITLYSNDPLMPIAMFIARPDQKEHPVEQLNPKSEDDSGNIFSMENASLLKSKDDLIGYAKEFGIVLVKATNVNIAKMRTTLKEAAIEKGYLSE
jgi:hypothetical protein